MTPTTKTPLKRFAIQSFMRDENGGSWRTVQRWAERKAAETHAARMAEVVKGTFRVLDGDVVVNVFQGLKEAK